MKKLISILLVICMLLCLSSTAFAASLTPWSSKDIVKPGERVVIFTMLDENITCATFAYKLYYDSDKFEFDAMRTGMWIEGSTLPQVDSDGRSYLVICYINMSGDDDTVESGGQYGISNPEFIAKETITERVDSYFELELYNCYDEDLNPVAMTGGKITVTIDPPIEGYYVESGEDKEVNVGDTVKDYIVINNDDETYYNAYHLVVNYDAEKLIYKSINTDATVKDENGTLTITGYGADLRTFWNDIILSFEAKAPGEAKLSIVSANIDKAANASAQDTPRRNHQENGNNLHHRWLQGRSQ